jgi:hypothetical protein
MPRQSNTRERDDQGRFVSDDDDGRYRGRRGGSYGRGADYDDDRRSSRGGGQSGWYGDSGGHSEASRRGWEDRR